MKLFVLFGQRKESYPGEYAPEALACIDECGMDENPAYIEGEHKKHRDSDEFEAIAVITLKVNGAKIMEILRPQQMEPLEGEIVHQGGQA